jgi:hypothetical protein
MSEVFFSVVSPDPFPLRMETLQNQIGKRFVSSSCVFSSDSTMVTATLSHCFCVPKSDIVEQGYDLSINRYKEVVHEEVDHRAPQAILDELESIEKEIIQGMKQLRGMIESGK